MFKIGVAFVAFCVVAIVVAPRVGRGETLTTFRRGNWLLVKIGVAFVAFCVVVIVVAPEIAGDALLRVGSLIAFVSFILMGWRRFRWRIAAGSLAAGFVVAMIGAAVIPDEVRAAREQRRIEQEAVRATERAEQEPAQADEDDPAELLTIIAQSSLGERDTTKRRFQFLLPRLVDRCQDTDSETHIGDMVAFTHSTLSEAGLEREEGGVLGIANVLHRMSSEISATTATPLRCSELLAMYVVRRMEGSTSETASGAVVTLVRELSAALERP